MKKIIFISLIFIFFTQSKFLSQCGWTQLLQNAPIYSIVKHPTNQNIIYAASQNSIYLSIDDGTTWISSVVSFSITKLAISRSSPDILYACTPVGKIYKTTDAGNSWTDKSTGITENSSVQDICIKGDDPNTVLIVLFNGTTNSVNGIYKTTNGGNSWFVSNSGIGSNKNFMSLCSSPLMPNTVYAGSSFSLNPFSGPCYIYKSYNFGGSWFNSGNGLGTSSTSTDIVKTFSISTIDTNTILAGLSFNTTNGGPYLSTNGGSSWFRRANGLPVSGTPASLINAVLIKPGYNNTFYLAGDHSANMQPGGVWTTTDAGLSWTYLWHDGSTIDSTMSVSCLYPGSGGFYDILLGGVKLPVGQHAGVHLYLCEYGVKKIGNTIPDKFSLSQNYPNPFNPSTKIKFSIPSLPLTKGAGGMDVHLKIFDLTGREIATLVNEKLSPGTYEAEWNATNFASGIYFYKLETESFSQTKRMVLIK